MKTLCAALLGIVLAASLSSQQVRGANVYSANAGVFNWSTDAATLWSTGNKPGANDRAHLGDDGSHGEPLVDVTVTTPETVSFFVMHGGATLRVAQGGSITAGCCSDTGRGSTDNANGYRSEIYLAGGTLNLSEFKMGWGGLTKFEISGGLFYETPLEGAMEIGFSSGSGIVEQTGGAVRLSQTLGMGTLSGAGWNGVDSNGWNLAGGALVLEDGVTPFDVNLSNSYGVALSAYGALYVNGDHTVDPTFGGLVGGGNSVAFGNFVVGGIAFNGFTRVAAAPQFDPADTDNDGDVDTADLTTMFQNFTGAVGLAGGKSMLQGDSDLDGDVDTADLTFGFQHFTGAQNSQVAASLASQPVPEPNSVILLALGALGLYVGRRAQR